MKLSQFKFKLPEDQIALYPHSIYREFENDKGEKETFRFIREVVLRGLPFAEE